MEQTSGGPGAQVSTTETAFRYRIDSRASRFTVKVSAAGLLAAMGHNPTIALRDSEGEASFVPATLDRASVRVTFQPDSFEVTDDISQKDRLEIEKAMKQDVLETSRYPQISFESTGVSPTNIGNERYAVSVAGNLNLHGMTRPQTIVCQVSVMGETLRASGEFSIRQTNYGIKLVSVAGGTLKVKDELKCSFEIVARRQE